MYFPRVKWETPEMDYPGMTLGGHWDKAGNMDEFHRHVILFANIERLRFICKKYLLVFY